MRTRRLLVVFGLSLLVCSPAFAGGAPPPPPAAHVSAPSSGGGGAAARGSGNAAAGCGSIGASGSSSLRQPYQGNRSTSNMSAATAARLAAAAKANNLANLKNANYVNGKYVQRTWVCAGLVSSTPCLDYQQLHPESNTIDPRTGRLAVGGEIGGQVGASASALNWPSDAWAAGLPANPHPLAPPILTNRSDEPAAYAIVLHGGAVLATTEAPRQSGNLIVGRDRGGRLFSLKASDVDLRSTLPQAPTAAPAPR
jgi:hypothetical protein